MSFRRCERGREFRCFAVSVVVAFAFLSANAEPQHRDASKAKAADESVTPDRLLAVPIQSGAPPVLPANVVAAKLVATSARRSSQLRGFRATRDYHLQYRGLLGSREATMQVLAAYTAPDKYDYTVVSQSGSKLLINRVLLKLLDSEREALRNRSQVDLSPANYDFDALGVESLDSAGPCYVLGVRPRKDNKFLYRGKIWVNAEDFAVVQMEGQPAKSPSFWIKDTDIDSNWQKVAGFWLSQHTRSVTHVRLGGTATLTIDYRDYEITDVGSNKGHGQSAQLPDPGSVTPQR